MVWLKWIEPQRQTDLNLIPGCATQQLLPKVKCDLNVSEPLFISL